MTPPPPHHLTISKSENMMQCNWQTENIFRYWNHLHNYFSSYVFICIQNYSPAFTWDILFKALFVFFAFNGFKVHFYIKGPESQPMFTYQWITKSLDKIFKIFPLIPNIIESSSSFLLMNQSTVIKLYVCIIWWKT